MPFEYTPALNLYFDDDLTNRRRNRLAGMLRGLMCAFAGWGIISGRTNEYFASTPVRLEFPSVRHAHRFQAFVERVLSEDVLASLKIRRCRRRI
jgi:hypothetical protein